jgi:hypothetical protein
MGKKLGARWMPGVPLVDSKFSHGQQGHHGGGGGGGGGANGANGNAVGEVSGLTDGHEVLESGTCFLNFSFVFRENNMSPPPSPLTRLTRTK